MTERRYAVEITRGAEDDLEEIHSYRMELRGGDDADALIDQFLAVIETLETFPERGAVPKELESTGIREFRQLLLGPYRLIYRVMDTRVIILVIVDGRRDVQTLLERRLLGRPA
ncbi:type II toxin-antitoxin system RelE/ParE family toxin [Novosphingobium colocasiae]|uniref:Plasmid stabilization protein n=1 Tax=Novosphingobium colocasiae TaxID=1256513 RepID=A0A918P9G8_9SPHN|nr:type II toxin-antitoxin system RelE/ParE family toxin [Novosphingobium colocasiae]GGY92504.1 plasmid stabilization protein [Novosphingobium colocasiae]